MSEIDDLALPGRETWRHRRVLYACLGVIALLLAGLIGSLPGLIAMGAIGATAIGLMGAQHLISRQLGEAHASPYPAGREAIAPAPGVWENVL